MVTKFAYHSDKPRLVPTVEHHMIRHKCIGYAYECGDTHQMVLEVGITFLLCIPADFWRSKSVPKFVHRDITGCKIFTLIVTWDIIVYSFKFEFPTLIRRYEEA